MQKKTPPLAIVKFLIKSGLAKYIPEFKKNSDDVSLLKFMSDSTLVGPHAHLRHMGSLLEDSSSGPADLAPIDMTLGAPDFGDGWYLDLLPKAGAKNAYTSLNYPPSQGFSELRQHIAGKLLSQNGLDYSPRNEILVSNGANHAVSLAMDTFVSPGDKVVLFDPSYMMYNFVAQVKRARICWVPTQLDDGYIAFSETKLAAAMAGAKIVFVNSPSNPSGCCMRRADLERIAYYAKKYDVLVFSDEVYEHFHGDPEYLSFASLPGMRSRTITVNSFSKSYGMAGARIGYMATRAELLRPIKMQMVVRCPFVNAWGQQVAQRMLQSPPSQLQTLRDAVNLRRISAYKESQSLGLPVTMPRGAFYLWLPTAQVGMSGREFAAALYATQRVMLMPGESFGPGSEDFVRISVSAASESVVMGLQRTGAFYKSVLQAPPKLV